MRSSAPASAAVATPWRRCPLPTKLHAIRQSGNAVRPFSYAARFLILGASSGAPNWHQPRQSCPSKTRAACAVPARTRANFRSRLGGTVPRLSSWNPMHQQPPKTPLLRSTSSANAGQVVSSKPLTVYSGTTADRNRFGSSSSRGTRHRATSALPWKRVEVARAYCVEVASRDCYVVSVHLPSASRRVRSRLICRMGYAGGSVCPLVTSDGMPPLRHPNGATDHRGVLRLKRPLKRTHATPPLRWQRRYPHADAFIVPWTRAGKLRPGPRFVRTEERGRCGSFVETRVPRSAVRCVDNRTYAWAGPCFPQRRNFRAGDLAACTAPGLTSFVRWRITARL